MRLGRKYVTRAFDGGATYVSLEKPFTVTAGEADSLIQLAENRGLNRKSPTLGASAESRKPGNQSVPPFEICIDNVREKRGEVHGPDEGMEDMEFPRKAFPPPPHNGYRREKPTGSRENRFGDSSGSKKGRHFHGHAL
jgi:hypothetical protein